MICTCDVVMWLPAMYVYVVVSYNIRVRICIQRSASLQTLNTTTTELWKVTADDCRGWNVLKYVNSVDSTISA